MANDRPKLATAIPWQPLITLLLTITSAAIVIPPLISSRPDQGEAVAPMVDGPTEVQARLWQDPFKAAEKAAPSTNPADNDLLWRNFKTKIERVPANEMLVLGVMIPAGPYAELVEHRHRTRIAVLEALARAGLEPENGERITHLTINLPETPSDTFIPKAERLPAISLPVPLEFWYKTPVSMAGTGRTPSESAPKAVVVIWLKEEAFGVYPAMRLSQLLNAIGHNIVGWRNPTSDEKRIRLRIIGPRVSNTLRAMALEAANPLGELCEGLKDVVMYSPTATAEEAVLLSTADSVATPEEIAKKSLAKRIEEASGLKLIRTTHTDDELSDALVDELRLRLAPNFGRRKHPTTASSSSGKLDSTGLPDQIGDIAIISEWDTFYGRALPLSFVASLYGQSPSEMGKHLFNRAAAQAGEDPLRVHFRYYLRGIDGKTPDGTSQVRLPGDKGGSTNSALRYTLPSEAPEGTNQSDYLRRLAIELTRLDQQLNAQNRAIKAIGVLGTDVYDKLLVLRALRRQFPGVIFFTTSFDARYALPNEWEAAHNLIIVSPFGLSLNSIYQSGVPPFRDGYQTSVFASTLAATGQLAALEESAVKNSGNQGYMAQALGAPRRYEIGRRGPYDLTVETESIDPKYHVQLGRVDSISSTSVKRIALLMALVAGLFILILAIGVRPEHISLINWIQLGCFALIICVVFWLAAISMRDGNDSQPLFLDSGLSTWPTIILRFITLIIGILLIIRAEFGRVANDRELEAWFKLDPLGPTKWWKDVFLNAWKVFGVVERTVSTGQEKCISSDDLTMTKAEETKAEAKKQTKDDTEIISKVYAQKLWWEYRRRSKTGVRLIRSSLIAGLYICLLLYLFDLTGPLPHAPTRGISAERFENWSFYSNGVIIIFLLVYVLDATYLNTRLMRYLAKTDTHWPEHSAKEYFRRSNQRYNIPILELTEYLDIRFIAMRTRVVGDVIYFPFLILVVVTLGRNSYFGNWNWPIVLTTAMGINLALAFVAVVLLRAGAEETRRYALDKIKARHVRCMVAGAPHANALEKIGDAIADEKQGAFSILFEYPVIGAVLLPAATVAVWLILDYMAKTIG